MKIKKLISVVMSGALICSAAFGINAIASENNVKESAVLSYGSADLAEYARQVAILVNKERAANGLQPLKVSPELSSAANIRAAELPENFSHTRPDGTSCFTAMSDMGITYRAAAENIAYGQKNPESVMNAWMNSSGHRANILNKNMEYIGVGVIYQNGVYYWSQFFAASDSLENGSYLPDENENIVTTTSAPAVTTQATTTVQTTSETQPTTTVQTTSAAQPTTTVQTTSAAQPTTTVQTTSAAQPTPIVQTTSAAQPTTTVQTTTSSQCKETAPCIIITKPVITIPSSGDCSSIGEGAFIIITNGSGACESQIK